MHINEGKDKLALFSTKYNVLLTPLPFQFYCPPQFFLFPCPHLQLLTKKALQDTSFWRSKFRNKEDSSNENRHFENPRTSYSLIGERANKRRSFKNAKLHWKLQIPFICSFVVHDLDSYSYGKKSVIDRLIYLHF